MKFSEITQKRILGNTKVSNTITIETSEGPFCHADGHMGNGLKPVFKYFVAMQVIFFESSSFQTGFHVLEGVELNISVNIPYG